MTSRSSPPKQRWSASTTPALTSRRARRWGHSLDSHHLASLARFAAGLALAESEAWEDDRRDVAMRAFTDRRHLIADRIVHWAVPLLAAAARHRGTEPDALGAITSIANEMRVAPGHVRGEGVHPPGEDGFGPLPGDDLDTAFLRSLWSGAVLVGKNRAAAADHAAGPLLRPVYEWWSVRWSDLADSEPATAALWIDLSMRAAHSARILGFCGKA